MDILVVIALVVGASVCFLPGVMAWSHYFGGNKQAKKKTQPARATRPVPTGHTC